MSPRTSPRCPAPRKGTNSAFLPNIAKTHVSFPEGYKSAFTSGAIHLRCAEAPGGNE